VAWSLSFRLTAMLKLTRARCLVIAILRCGTGDTHLPRPGETSLGRLGQGQPELLARAQHEDDATGREGPLGERLENANARQDASLTGHWLPQTPLSLKRGVAAPSVRKPAVAYWAQCRGFGPPERISRFHPPRQPLDAVFHAMLTPGIRPRFIAQNTPAWRRTWRPPRHVRHNFAQYLAVSRRLCPSC
jgi:hypothetical protein